ncbi:hypothetical protein MASR2M12_20360 [Bacteroidales bacterium]
MKKIAFLSLIAAFLMSCGNNPKTSSDNASSAESIQPVQITVANFSEKAPELVDKLISIRGIADHICKHDGKKLFLVDTISDGRVKIVTGENVAAFNNEYEGYDFEITGKVLETVVDEAYLQEWEEEIKAGIEEKKHLEGGKPAEATEEDHHSDEEAMQSIQRYRDQMAEKGINKLSFYSIEATSYQVIKEE